MSRTFTHQTSDIKKSQNCEQRHAKKFYDLLNHYSHSNCFYIDKENPVIVNLPTSFTRPTDSGKAYAVVSWTTPTTTDNSNRAVTLESNPKSDTQFVIGPTTVMYTATDAYNNVDTKSFVVTVEGRVTQQVITCDFFLICTYDPSDALSDRYR